MGSRFQLGAIIEGRFEVIRPLGEGSMGTVWLARDRKIGIEVALKVMRSAMRDDPARVAAFEREAELCARMMSPHIVRVLSYGVTTHGMPYIVYEALSGETLDTRIGGGKKPTLEQTEDVVVHVARALARAHSMGVVHKDIKPGNVFLGKDDGQRTIAKVLDFGIAEVARPDAGAPIQIAGTPEYMPLEVLCGAAADARADLFALAVVAYECIAGVVPYVATESLMDLIDAMKTAPPSLARVLSEEAAVPLDAWMQRGLAPEAALRFQSARELAETFHVAVKQARAALGLIPAAATRRSIPMAERMVPLNNIDTVPPSRRTANDLGDAARAAMNRLASAAPAAAMSARPPLPPMRPKAQSFVFEEELLAAAAAAAASAATASAAGKESGAIEETVEHKQDDKRRE